LRTNDYLGNKQTILVSATKNVAETSVVSTTFFTSLKNVVETSDQWPTAVVYLLFSKPQSLEQNNIQIKRKQKNRKLF